MIAFYIVCAVLGGGLAIASAIMGGHGHDTDISHDVDHGGDSSHDSDTSAAIWGPFLSIRFWVNFLFGTGLVGLLLTYLAKSGEPFTLTVSLITGFGLGLAVNQILAAVRRMETPMSQSDMEGIVGKVLVPISKASRGKIRAVHNGETLDFIATTDHDGIIETGTEVVIVTFEKECAVVIRASELMEN